MHIEAVGWMRNIRLSSVGDRQSLRGWSRVELELTRALGATDVRPAFIGAGLASMALLIAGTLIFGLSRNHDVLVQNVLNFLRQH
jgi:hypothetical protein